MQPRGTAENIDVIPHALAPVDIPRKHRKATLAKLDHDKAALRVHECWHAIFVPAEGLVFG